MRRFARQIGGRGFTLIEMVIALMIVALVTGAAVPTINSLTGATMRSAALKLSGNIKYLYDRAILEQVYVRLVFDFEQNVYWSEVTKDPLFLSQKPQTVEEGAVVVEEEEEDEDELFDLEDQTLFNDVLTNDQQQFKWGGWADFAAKFKKKKPEFSEYRTELTMKTELPKGVRLYRVATQSVEEPVTAGQVYIHFFPKGYVEKAAVALADAGDLEDETLLPADYDVYSVLVEPLNGRSAIYNSLVELPEDEEDEDEW
ncbi:MAG: type II secretion system protein [Myxococcales bacterium]|nr:MAG: type II secretion system protein [Myxococcales bacterium]